MPEHYADPTQKEQIDFLFRLYFGGNYSDLRLAINRAHRDFSRTVHGIRAYPNARRLATESIHDSIAKLPMQHDVPDQAVFDLWHKKSTLDLCTAYQTAGYKDFFVGQAQKWINMALKYIHVFGESRIPGYQKFYPYCHVPIDSIILAQDEFKNLRSFSCAWSRIDNYDDEYMAFQRAVRQKFTHSSPLAVEFLAWQQKSAI